MAREAEEAAPAAAGTAAAPVAVTGATAVVGVPREETVLVAGRVAGPATLVEEAARGEGVVSLKTLAGAAPAGGP